MKNKKGCIVSGRLTFTGWLLHIRYENELVYSEPE